MIKRHKDTLSFTAYGNPFFAYRYYKSGVLEKDAENILSSAGKLLAEFGELLGSAADID